MSYKNRDSFMLMEYTCDKCHRSELIWNSRDNVSPFSLKCAVCDGMSSHSNWLRDIRVINYAIPVGSRYFADYTLERAQAAAKRRIACFIGTEFEVTENTEEYTELFKDLTNTFMQSMDVLTKE